MSDTLAADVREALERNAQLREAASGTDPDVEHALAILRHKGLWAGIGNDIGTPTTTPSSGVASEAGDVEMVEEAASFTKKLESDEAFKKQFDDMLAAGGDAGAEAKRLFSAVSERAAKRRRKAGKEACGGKRLV